MGWAYTWEGFGINLSNTGFYMGGQGWSVAFLYCAQICFNFCLGMWVGILGCGYKGEKGRGVRMVFMLEMVG